MALLNILQYPHPTLAAKAAPVTEFNDDLKTLAADMLETMYAAPGVGLAANQSGQMVLVNPEILSSGEELVDHEEGCLSLKGLYEHVKRPSTVKVRAQDLDGNPFEFDADGLLAVCVQHELDHLDGKVFIDHLSRMKKERARMKLLKLRRKREHEREEEA